MIINRKLFRSFVFKNMFVVDEGNIAIAAATDGTFTFEENILTELTDTREAEKYAFLVYLSSIIGEEEDIEVRIPNQKAIARDHKIARIHSLTVDMEKSINSDLGDAHLLDLFHSYLRQVRSILDESIEEKKYVAR